MIVALAIPAMHYNIINVIIFIFIVGLLPEIDVYAILNIISKSPASFNYFLVESTAIPAKLLVFYKNTFIFMPKA